MIRLLTETDRAAAIRLLASDVAHNLYALGNLQTLGFDEPYCRFWGDFADEAASGTLRGVLNRYRKGWVLFGEANADWRGLAQVVDNHPAEAERLQDNPGGTESLLPFLQNYAAQSVRVEQLMRLSAQNFSPPPAVDARITSVRRATLADLDALSGFFADADNMSRTRATVEEPLRQRRVWLAEQDGEVLAAALTNAELSGDYISSPSMVGAAMIGGVFTRLDARGRGLSKAVCGGLCEELLALGKTPFLYWDNPAAGAVYRSLGFEPAGTWRAVRLKRA